MTAVVVGLGTNRGSREALLRAAVAGLARDPALRVVGASPLFETDPVGPARGRFLNAAARVETDLTLDALLDRCLALELAFGRDRAAEGRWGSRTLDLDLLWASSGPYRSERLTVPHPRLGERAFALWPLACVAPEAAPPEVLAPHPRPEEVGDLARPPAAGVTDGEAWGEGRDALDAWALALSAALPRESGEPGYQRLDAPDPGEACRRALARGDLAGPVALVPGAAGVTLVGGCAPEPRPRRLGAARCSAGGPPYRVTLPID